VNGISECLTDWQRVEKHYQDNRPLNENHRRVIDANRHQLALVIDPKCGIIDQLYHDKCFNELHKDHIECGINTYNKADRLLDIVRRRSVANFKKLAALLHTDGCPLLARLLMEGGGK